MKEMPTNLKIPHAVIELEVMKGHLRWTVAALARKVKVSRPLIYYHFGRTKEQILDKSILLVAEEYFGINPERIKMLQEGRAVESLLLTRKLLRDTPAFGLFYSRGRVIKSPLQKKLIEIENRYQAMLKNHFPQLSEEKIRALHGLFYGIVMAPFLDEKSIAIMIQAAGVFDQISE